MIIEKDPKLPLDSNFHLPEPMIIVTKSNYVESFRSFKHHLSDEKCAYLFFNMEVSQPNITRTEKIKIDLSSFKNESKCESSFLTSFLQANNSSSLDSQIIYTEFLIVKEAGNFPNKSYKLIPFLIPSLKFPKYAEKESLVKLTPEVLTYLNSVNHLYPLGAITDLLSLSYLNLNEEENIKSKFERILSEGKPVKKDAYKSYYFFPKNILLPTNTTKEILEKHIESIFLLLKERKEETQTSDEEMIVIDNNFYIVEKLLNFEWRHILTPYDKNLININIKSLKINKINKNISEQDHIQSAAIFKWYKTFLNLLKCQVNNLITHEGEKHFQVSMAINEGKNYFLLVEEIVFVNWNKFIESFFDYKIRITLEFLKDNLVSFKFKALGHNYLDEEQIINFFNVLNKLENIFNEDEYFQETPTVEISQDEIYKNNNLRDFNLIDLFPKKIENLLNLSHCLSVKYNQTLLKNVNLERSLHFKFNDLFLNLNNEKDILFEYELEKELFLLINNLKKEVENTLIKLGKNYISVNNPILLNDLNLFCRDAESKTALEEVFKGKLGRLNVDLKKQEFKFELKGDKEELINDFILNKEVEVNIRYELIKVFVDLKKKQMLEEEFGISNFFKFILTKNKTLVGCNMITKLELLFTQIFRKLNEEDFPVEDFKLFCSQLNFLDMNVLCAGKLIKSFNLYNANFPNMLNTVKYFNILINKIDAKIVQPNNKFLINNYLYSENQESDSLINNNLITLDMNQNLYLDPKEESVNSKVNEFEGKYALKITIGGLNRGSQNYFACINKLREYGDFMV